MQYITLIFNFSLSILYFSFGCGAAAAGYFSLCAQEGGMQDNPGRLSFDGPTIKDLDVAKTFSRQVNASLAGVLDRNYVYPDRRYRDGSPSDYPAGTLHSAPRGTGHWASMWTRDVGVFLRELAMWGYIEHAKLTASTLIDLVSLNEEGFYTYPEQLGKTQSSGHELDGTAAIVIAMIRIWQRLPADDPIRKKIYDFLHAETSPLKYVCMRLDKAPLIAGTGEFGPGCWISGSYCNVVQNNLCRLALIAGADFEEEAGNKQEEQLYRNKAAELSGNMLKYLVDSKDGKWIWCVKPSDLQPDPEILNAEVNRGAGLINGVGCMLSDAVGFDLNAAEWQGDKSCEATFEKLYNTEPRKKYFDEIGIWTQFDPPFRDGKNASPSYGQGYALQYMLLSDRLTMAGKALDWLARVTNQGAHPEWFVEQMNYPFEKGNYFLNVVNVSEPLKVARLILGVDDARLDEARLIPRPIGAITSIEANNWSIRTSAGVVQADIKYELKKGKMSVSIRVRDGKTIPALKLRVPEGDAFVWKTAVNVQKLEIP
ncbi:hypothetical protein JW926_11080 [Candidatus Sumerlaeota bacterium]|nr:hypothetical protein [Candidatus Sumerlaeota bacterium]